MTPSVVLVTGVGRFLGARVAAALVREPGVGRVIGVDVGPPLLDGTTRGEFEGSVEFVQTDLGHPQVARLVTEAGVDTIVHASVGVDPAPGDRSQVRQNNIVGTMRLLAACQRSDRLRRLVVRSTTAVYGTTSCDPALFVEEDTETELPPRGGPARDAVDVETHVRAFARHRPDVSVVLFRLANLVGPRVRTPLARYLRPPVVPTVLGYDPRLQFLHEQDAVEVFRLAAIGEGMSDAGSADFADLAGPTGAATPSGFRVEQRHRTINVAGSGVLLLSQMIRRAGRVALPVPDLAGPAGAALAGLVDLVGLHPARAGLLTLGGIVDTTRLRREFGYQPHHTSAQAFDEFVRGQLPGQAPGMVNRAAVSKLERAARRLLVGDLERPSGG
ncbi:MAG TPA: NAD-dependent epimerase/dehydratase family protein [Mycobacteriales bacterium]